MQFLDFIKLPDQDKVILVEVKAGKEIQGLSWTATGGGSHWCDFTDGEIVAVSELDNTDDTTTDYAKVASIASCDSTTSSFYFDYSNQRLYVHTSGDDAPDTQDAGDDKYCMIAYSWLCITNQQDEETPTIYTPQDASNPVYYLPYLDPTQTHSLLQQVKDFYTGIVPWYRATLKFLNDGWFYEAFESWIWHNKEIEAKLGAKGSAYSDFEVIIKGRVRNPSTSDEGAALEVRDARVGELKQLPIASYFKSATGYPNLEDEADGWAQPVLFGKKSGITPVCINTTTWIYKVNYYAQEAIDAVYRDGELLTLTTDYTVNGDKNEFTLLEDPGEALITCDARGVKCDKDTDTYSENVVDFLWFALETMNSIPVSRLDDAAFDSLKSSRSQRLAWYMNESISTFNFIRLLQQTSLFQFIPLPNGKYTVKFYESGVPAGTPELEDKDYAFLKIFYSTSAIYGKTVVKYDRNPTTGEWKKEEYSDDEISFRHGDERTITIESALRLREEAESLTDMYRQMATLYEKRVKGKISPEGVSVLPTEKIEFTKSMVSSTGESITVLDEEVYRILELRKDFKTMKTEVVGVKDEIGSSHANAAHTNLAHVNSYTDSIHSDAHTDNAHQNALHANYTPHSDTHGNWYSDHTDDPQP